MLSAGLGLGDQKACSAQWPCSVARLLRQCLRLYLPMLALCELKAVLQHTGQGQQFNVWVKSEGCQQGLHTKRRMVEMQRPCVSAATDACCPPDTTDDPSRALPLFQVV